MRLLTTTTTIFTIHEWRFIPIEKYAHIQYSAVRRAIEVPLVADRIDSLINNKLSLKRHPVPLAPLWSSLPHSPYRDEAKG